MRQRPGRRRPAAEPGTLFEPFADREKRLEGAVAGPEPALDGTAASDGAAEPRSGCLPLLVLTLALAGWLWWPLGVVAWAVSFCLLIANLDRPWRGWWLLVPAYLLGQWWSVLLAMTIFTDGARSLIH